jgi:ApbE superfamily uncharacterized protein (UPF0280 family)
MMQGPCCTRLPDGARLHLSHGPIDLVLQAFGTPAAVRAAEQAALRRFATILEELCAELPLLRSPSSPTSDHPHGATARRMSDAVRPLAAHSFITPMAAVAGAVADEILAAMTGAASLEKAYVNNGGDIALHLAAGSRFTLGIVDRVGAPHIAATASLFAESPVRGIATSGWGGRSFSLGIADAVTILARSAAAADAAATLVANAVDLPHHPSVQRRPATDLQPESDLGTRAATTFVGHLEPPAIAKALGQGRRTAEDFAAEGHIIAAALFLKGQGLSTGDLALADTTLAHPAQRAQPRIPLHA